MFETVTVLIKAIRGYIVYFSNPVSEFLLTYHREFIDEDSIFNRFNVGSEEKRML
jgi:hypothetical protein